MDENEKIAREFMANFKGGLGNKLNAIINDRMIMKYEVCEEENKKLRELLVQKMEWKRKVIREKIEVLKNEMKEKNNHKTIQVKKCPGDGEVSEKHDDDLPFLLRPQFQDILLAFVSQLDLCVFTRFTQTCKKLYNLAQNGVLKVPITLSCVTYKQCEIDSEHSDHDEYNESDDEADVNYVTDVLVLKHNLRPLNYLELMKLHECKWLRPTISSMFLKEFEYVEYEATRLLDHFGIKEINYLETKGDVEVHPMLMRYKVKSLNCRDLTSTELLKSREVHQVKKIKMSFDVNVDSHKDLMDFLLSSSIPDIHAISDPCLPPSFANQIIDKWMARETVFKSIRFDVEFEEEEQVLAELLQKSAIYLADESLDDVSMADIQEIISPLRPLVVCGIDDSFVVIREDLKMLNVFYKNYDDEENYYVIMKELDEFD